MTALPRPAALARSAAHPAPRTTAWACAAGAAAFAALGLAPGGMGAATALQSALVVAVAGVLAASAARRGRARRPWLLLAAGVVVLVLGRVAMLLSQTGHAPAGVVAVSAFRDHPGAAVLGLLAYPLLHAGQMALFSQRVEGLRASARLDGALSGTAVLAAALALAGPALHAAHGVGALGAVALLGRLVGDLLGVAVALATWGASGWRSDRRLPLLAAAFAALLLSDAAATTGAVGLLGAPGAAGAAGAAASLLPVAVGVARIAALGAMAVAASLPAADPTGRRAAAGTSTLAGDVVVLLVGTGLVVLDRVRGIGPVPFALAVAVLLGAGLKLLLVAHAALRLVENRQQAHTDDLTGLPNRRALRAAMATALAGGPGRGGPVSLLLVDLDRFKHVNDRFGHTEGDRVLQRTARRLQALVRPGELLARLGGDEFALLLPGASPARTGAVAAGVVAAAGAAGTVAGSALTLGASVGLAVGARGDDAGELLRRADVAMYRAKAAGGGTAAYEAALDEAAQERAALREDLREALAAPGAGRGRLVAHYQPQVRLADGAVTGVEALVRFEHPERGLLAPAAFLALAEEDGLLPALTDAVLAHALPRAAAWRAAGHDVRVAVNLAAPCLDDPDLLARVDAALARAGLPPGALVLEVTETGLVSDPERGLAVAARLAARGIALSIDDYGTGCSSLAHLNDLPAAELKLDRAFTARLVTDERTAVIVAATVDLAHALGLRLVAEGVEDAEALAALRAAGCDETQGYLHARPMPAEELVAWLAARERAGSLRPGAAGPAARG